MARLITKCFLVVSLFSGWSFAQNQPVEPASLEGKVMDAVSGAPVRKAALTLRGLGNPGTHVADTASDGAFSFSGVEPGRYRLTLEKPGYLTQEYGSKEYQYGGETIVLASADKKTGVEFKAMPQGVLTGRVVDEDGEPLPQASVSAAQKTKWSQQANTRNANANDIGEFRVPLLGPGRYILTANYASRRIPRPVVGVIDGVTRLINTTGVATQKQPGEDYTTTYFPAATDEAAASVIELGPGQQIDNLIIRMRKTQVYSVRGTAKYSGAKPIGEQAPQINLVPKTGNRQRGGRPYNTVMQKDGSFQIESVPAGSYYVCAFRYDLGPWPLMSVPIEVSGNVENLSVSFGDPVKLKAAVVWEDPAETKPVNGYISFQEKDGFSGSMANTQVKDGSAAVSAAAGVDTPQFSSQNGMGFMKQVREKSGADLNGVINLSGSDYEVVIVISTKTATVEGVVTSDSKNPKKVFLVPDDLGHRPFASRSFTTDGSGRYKLERIVPGAYKLFAFDEDVPPAAMGELAQLLGNKGVSITLAESAKETRDLGVTELPGQ